MKFVIDIVVILIVLISTVFGAKKGFVKTFLSVLAFLISVYISFSFSPVVSQYVQTKFIAPKITQALFDGITSGSDALEKSLPSLVINYSEETAEKLDMLVDSSKGANDETVKENITNFVDSYVNPPIVEVITTVIAIISFLLLSTLLHLIVKALNKIITISPIKSLNTVGGMLLGCINGFVFGAAFCLILSVVFSFNSEGFFIFTDEAVENSYFYCYFNNLLHK